jgi:hypothetical protein
MSFGYAPATAQLNLKPGEAGWVYCDPSALPLRYGTGVLNLPKFPMWEYARFTGQSDPGDRIIFRVPTGCRIELEPETELDRLTYEVAKELEQKVQNPVPVVTADQQQITTYGERKKNLQAVDLDSSIPDDMKRKYYEYLKKELVSISKELPLIKALAEKCSDYLTDRSAEIGASWEKIDAKIAVAERRAEKRLDREKNRNGLWETINLVGGIALSTIPYVGSILSAVGTTAVTMVNAKYNADQLNKIARTLGQAYDQILYEEHPDALNALDETIRKDSGRGDAIINEAGFFIEAKAVESRLLLCVEKLKRGIWDTDTLLASLGTKSPTVTASAPVPAWMKWAAIGGAALVLYYML